MNLPAKSGEYIKLSTCLPWLQAQNVKHVCEAGRDAKKTLQGELTLPTHCVGMLTDSSQKKLI